MIIKQISLTIKYSIIEELQRKVYANCDILQNEFYLNNQISIPDNAPYDIPRFIFKSKNGHSEINISPIALVMNVFLINNGYEKEWSKCSEYLKNKISIISSFVEKIKGENFKYEYIGLVTNVEYDEYASDDVVEYIKKNLLKSTQLKNLFDVNVRYSFVEGEELFVNIALQNVREYKGKVIGNKSGDFSSKNLIKETIGANIDINDRYLFNIEESYSSNINIFEKLNKCMADNINEKVKRLIEEGLYDDK